MRGCSFLIIYERFPVANILIVWLNQNMKIINKEAKINLEDLNKMAEKMFGNLVKAVVDVEKEIIAIDAELHADEEKELIERGSKQFNLWGINLYPQLFDREDFIEFDSMINLRPSQNNRSRDVEDPKIKEKIIIITNKLIEK